MKKKLLLFVFVTLCILTFIPAINLIQIGIQHNKDGKKWWGKSVLYNLDFSLPYLNNFFYRLGISTTPNQVVIGKNDWLFLGDQYQKTLSLTRSGANVESKEIAKRIELAGNTWEQWLKLKSVSIYRIILGPNKTTIYPEFLPNWIQPAAISTTDDLLTRNTNGVFIDTRPALRAAKLQFLAPLYYKTDTHWNDLGAWIAFRAFSNEVSHADNGLHWLSDQNVHISETKERLGGDLANFLWLQDELKDSEVPIEIITGLAIETEQYDFETGHLIQSGGNPIISAPPRPLLIKSTHALNQKRVLWLRDSFGTALAPYMAATFSETLQLHYGATDPNKFAQLVDTFKPNYVFVTVVEREVLGDWFEKFPPAMFISGKPEKFILLSHGIQTGINDMVKNEGIDSYKIIGIDPFITFNLPIPIQTQAASQLAIDFNCEKKNPVQIQIFWHTANTAFNETNSVHLAVTPGVSTIDLSPFFTWNQAGAITDVRIDFDSTGTCPILTFKNIELGTRMK